MGPSSEPSTAEPSSAEPTSSPKAAESPFRRLLNLLRITNPPDTAEDIEQEIQEILEEGEEQGLVTPEEGEMIASVMELKDTLVYEIMTPRTEMVLVQAATPLPDLIQLIIERGFSRIPVYQENPDQIIGVIHVKDLLPYCLKNKIQITAGDLARAAKVVRENHKVIELLKYFQQQKTHLAVVKDEFGSVRGLITLEDIVEEIVGDINDEHSRKTHRWKEVNPHTVLTDAKVDIEDVEEFFDVELPKGPYESVGGLIIHQLDQVPLPGATLIINSLFFEVIAADKRRVIKVKIQKK